MSLSLVVPEKTDLPFSSKKRLSVYVLCITALASATGGLIPPPPPGGEAPGRRRAKPSDSVEQEAKPPVRKKVEKRAP